MMTATPETVRRRAKRRGIKVSIVCMQRGRLEYCVNIFKLESIAYCCTFASEKEAWKWAAEQIDAVVLPGRNYIKSVEQ